MVGRRLGLLPFGAQARAIQGQDGRGVVMGDFIMGYLIGRTIRLTFRLAGFLFRIAWWLGVFVLLSIGAGAMALIKLGQAKPDETQGFGVYSPDRTVWRDRKTNLSYPVSDTETEYCEVHATQDGQYWRRTAISRLVRMGAIVRYRFNAVIDHPDEGQSNIAATVDFPQEARVNITLDHVDPALAASDPYGLNQNRELATSALDHLDWLLTNRGWQAAGLARDTSNEHWYAKRYSRPLILRDEPANSLAATDASARPTELRLAPINEESA